MGADAVGIAHHGCSRDELTGSRLHALHAASSGPDLLHGAVGPNLYTEIASEGSQCLGHRSDPAHRIPDTVARLHARDPAENGRGIFRVAAHILSEMVKHLSGPLIGHKCPNGSADTVARPHPHDLFEKTEGEPTLRIEHVLHATHGPPEEVVV